MPFADVDGLALFYEFSGDQAKPLLLEFGGSLLSRHHFDAVNDRLREHFRILAYDPRGYGRSSAPLEPYSVCGWADEAAGLLDSLGIEQVRVLGSSGGGMNALAFAGRHPQRTVAVCADCCYARPDLTRRMYFRIWRRMLDSMAADDVSDLIITQVLSPEFLESHEEWLASSRAMTAAVSKVTLAQAFLAQETMDLESTVAAIASPTLMTNFTGDILCPPALGPSGFGARDMAAANSRWVRSLELDGNGHAPLVEAADTVLTAMIEHLLAA
jgi:pimeloyl-ACP methyl ester carboxylesterase